MSCWAGNHNPQFTYPHRYSEWNVVSKFWSSLTQHSFDRFEFRYQYMICLECGKEFKKGQYRSRRLG